MADAGRKQTDKELQKLEERIKNIYGNAALDVQQEIFEYFASFAKQDAELREKLEAGEITEEYYTQWRLNQIGRGERFLDLRDKLAERMTKANETAIAYVNDATPGIYTLSRNYAAYEMESAGAGVDFTLYDESTVRRLIKEQPDLMPYYPEKKALKRGIDLEYGKKQITAHVTSGILTGGSMNRIAAALCKSITDMSVTSAIRAARTAVTAAENGGRTASYKLAADRGIELTREWIATKDARTRHSHGAADGQRVGVDEPFTVGGEKLMFPGDGSLGATGKNLYNCRCTIKAMVKGHERTRETYAEWLEKKMADDPDGTSLEFKKAARRGADYAQWQEYRKYAGKETPKSFVEFQNLKYNNAQEWSNLKTVKEYKKVIKTAPCETTPKKYTAYFLKEGTNHSKDFFEAGYTKEDALRLRYDMAKQFDESKAERRIKDNEGKARFVIYMKLGNKQKTFRTAWIKDSDNSKPRIVTAFREDKKDDK